ncbi:MAG TPA: sigma-70 family RNA polymerase sigma factor [Kineosporiaceae bacterium]
MGAAAIARTHSPGLDRSVRRDDDEQGPSDAELVARCASDPEAFGLLYDRHCDRIYRYVNARLRDRTIAEDVTAEVFFKALKGLGSYRPEVGEFSAWLYRIAGNAVIDHIRSRKVTVSLDEQMDRSDRSLPVEQQVIDRVEVAQVWRAIGELTDAQRTAVLLRLERDLPIAEIAGRMNRTEGAVKLLLHRGMSAVRAKLAELEVGRGRR